MATISTLLDIGLMVWLQYPLCLLAMVWLQYPLCLDIGLIWLQYPLCLRHWFDGMATISTLLDIGLMVWLQYPLC